MKKYTTLILALIFISTFVLISCSRKKNNMSEKDSKYQQLALEFTTTLAERQYAKAYEMTSQEYRTHATVDKLKKDFETIVPNDFGPIGPIKVGRTMTSWPGKQPSDIGWAYLSIGGDVYSEALVVIVTNENGNKKVREIEFGRP